MKTLNAKFIILLILSLNSVESFADTNWTAQLECSILRHQYSFIEKIKLPLIPIQGTIYRNEPTLKIVNFEPKSYPLTNSKGELQNYELLIGGSYLRSGVEPVDPKVQWVASAGSAYVKVWLLHKASNGTKKVVGYATGSSNSVSSPAELERLTQGLEVKRIPVDFNIHNTRYLNWVFERENKPYQDPTPEEAAELTEVLGECYYVQSRN